MQQLFDVWARLSLQRKLITIGATVGVFVAVLGLARLANAPTMSLLYAGLEGGAAGEIVASLEQQGVQFEVKGDSIFVDAAQRDSLRMVLASEGLPSTTNKGYELLDNLSGFSTTSQMFDAAYLRAKEGELARTIMSSPNIRSARVHIANIGTNPFRRNVDPTASVTVLTQNGGVSAAHAKALKFLISSAVAGLMPENVAIIDAAGNLIGAADEQSALPAGEERSATLRERVLRLLEARVGFGNAVVEVSVDTVTETESIVERRFDPESRVAISTDTEERTNSAEDTDSGDVTVASNLPEGDAGASGKSSSQNSETRERVNYEVSETQREVIRAPGDIKRLTVAVLVNGTAQVGEDGVETLAERPAAELESLRELVASAVGFDEDRGDVITLKSMQFEPVVPMGTVAEPSLLQKMNLDVMSLIQMAVLAVVALVLGLFVIRPLFASGAAELGQPLALPQADNDDDDALTGEIEFATAPLPSLGGDGDTDSSSSLVPAPSRPQDPVERLRSMIGERQEETVEILRSWMEESEEKA